MGIAIQALGWACGLVVVLGAPLLPLIAVVVLPLAAMIGMSETSGSLMLLAPAFLFALLPLSLILVSYGEELRTSPIGDHVCRVCGYDLRGSEKSQRCSECGSSI
jgi:hypothetical protein